jgi:trypsin
MSMCMFLVIIIATLLLPASALGSQSHLRQAQVKEAQGTTIIDTTSGPVTVDSYLTNDATPLTITPQIIGGSATEAGAYPYFATTASSVCGATLIHPDIILTAAHCQKEFARIGVIFIGAHQLNTLVTTAERRTLIRQYPHPDNDNVPLQSDLMLFQVNEPVYTLPVVPLNSDPDLPHTNATLTVIGFGVTSTTNYFSYSDHLQEVDIYPISSDTCQTLYNDTVPVDAETMLCAGHALPNFDSCNGDSGGPLLDTVTGAQVGIVSFGKGCGDPDFPGVYTRVSTYTSWIHDRICELSAVPPADCPIAKSSISKMDSSVQNSDSELTTNIMLEIQYDHHPTESFWRLEEDATGKVVAFQPDIPSRNALVRQVIALSPGRAYTLHFVDIVGDGICCTFGEGKVVIRAQVAEDQTEDEGDDVDIADADAPADVAVAGRQSSRVDVLASSDGQFGNHLALSFVVAPAPGSVDEDDDTTADTNSGSGIGNEVNLVAILVGVALLSVTVLM